MTAAFDAALLAVAEETMRQLVDECNRQLHASTPLLSLIRKDPVHRDRHENARIDAELRSAEKDGEPRTLSLVGVGTITARIHNVGPRTLWLIENEDDDDNVREFFPAILDVIDARPASSAELA